MGQSASCCVARETDNITGGLGAVDAASRRAAGRGNLSGVASRMHRERSLEDDYTRGTGPRAVLGTGLNGEVHRGLAKVGGRKVAIKTLNLLSLSESDLALTQAELEVFLCVDHPHVVRLLDVYVSNSSIKLVMECMEGGELLHRVRERKKFSECDAANAVHDMLLAVNYMHSENIVHRDLKLENFLYETKDADHLKLADFGFSKVTNPNQKLQEAMGTAAYVAPEVLGHTYTNKCDIWSMGVITYILLSGAFPFWDRRGEAATIQKVLTGQYTMTGSKWDMVSSTAKDFVTRLLAFDPSLRTSAADALAHPWMKSRETTSSSLDVSVVNALSEFANASSLRRAILTVMAWSLKKEDRAKVRDIFKEIDADGTGSIDICELREKLQGQLTGHDSEKLFQALVIDGAETIKYSTFLAAMTSDHIELTDANIDWTFNKFDKDKSGYLSLTNFKEVLGDEFDGTDVGDLLKSADTDGDGKISREEFESYLKLTMAADQERFLTSKSGTPQELPP